MSEIKLPKDFREIAIMASEPLKGYTPIQMREMASKYHSDEALAAIYASVSNKTGWLGHDIGEPENDEETNNRLKKEHEEWWTLEKELYAEIVCRLQKENAEKGTAHIITGKGMWYIAKPFMERNGFKDGAGWWVNSDLRERRKK